MLLREAPWPTNGGARLRVASIVDSLSALGDVDVLIVMPEPAPGVDPPFPLRSFDDVRLPLRHPFVALVTTLVRRLPWQIAVCRWSVAERHLREQNRGPYDLAWFGSFDLFVSLRRAVAAGHTIVDSADVETDKLQSFLDAPPRPGWRARIDRLQRRVELPMWAAIQRRVLRHADAIVVCSELDRSRLGAPAHVHVSPNTYPDPGAVDRHPDPAAPVLLMLATYGYAPNPDAAEWAAREIMPRVLAHLPAARLRLVGRDRERIVHLEALPGVDVVGPVDHVTAELAAASLVLTPIRFGGGTRLKIVEAFAHGVPVVATTLGAEGLGAEPDVHLAIADDAAGLAAACVHLLTHPLDAERLAHAGRALYEETLRPDVSRAVMTEVVHRLLR